MRNRTTTDLNYVVFHGILNLSTKLPSAVKKTLLTVERERFAQVMAARKSARELIGLADKLLESDKFSPWYKPYCFADFVAACTERVGVSALEDLLVALKNAWVGDIIRSVYKDDTDQVVCALVRRALEVVSKDDAVERRLHLMLFAGLVKSGEHAIELALDAGLPAEGEVRLRAVLERLAARPLDDSCPF